MAWRSFLLGALSLVLVLAGCSGGPWSAGGPTTDSPPAQDPVVASFADTTLTFSELKRAYKDANALEGVDQGQSGPDSTRAYQDFLDQYVNFRLKVRAARDAGLDTMQSVLADVASYRQKMARPKVMRTQVYEPLARELYDRQQQQVDVSHILKRVPQEAPPEDTLKAYRELQALEDSLRQGVSFADLAYRHSDDPSAQKKGQRGYRGRLGPLQAGQIVEPFEERMYSVPPDSVSDIFRTRFGYHLLKVHERTPARPPVRLSHIMIQPTGDSIQPRSLLDSLRTELVRNDADFAALAKKYSDDRKSAAKGGDLGMIESMQSLPPSFRNAVTELDSIGAVTDVVRTKFGYHLIKLTDREERTSFEDAYEDLKETLSGRPRVERRKEAVARRIRTETGTSVDTTRLLRAAGVSTMDTLSRPLLSTRDADPPAARPVATLGDSTYSLDQLAGHVLQTDGGSEMTIGEVTDDFLNEKAWRYAAARLERRDSSFAATMKQYREGLLVFQFMQDSVWSVAARDTAGLRRTYQKRRDQYRFPERVRTLVLRAPTDSLLTPYQEAYTDDSALPSVLRKAQSDSLVTVDTTLVTDSASPPFRQMRTVPDGSTTGPLMQEGEALFLIRDTRLPPRPKTFEEARSDVLRDYQEIYEEEVISRLRRRYNAEIYPERL